jgi:peptidyl-tRNA hydrolase, PTH2 family
MTFLYYLVFGIICFIFGATYKKILFALARKLKIKIKEYADKQEEAEAKKADNSTKSQNDNNSDDEGEEVFDFEDADLKMVFLVRDDLKLGAGKIAAQVAHAAVGLTEKINEKGKSYYKQALEHWSEFGAKKIVLRAKDLEELKNVHKQCKKLKIPSIMISDAGHTQVDPGTVTVVGIGVEDSSKLDKITGGFKLMR